MATTAATRPSGPALSIPSYRSASPTRVKLAGGVAARSPGKPISVSSPKASSATVVRNRQSCMCSPTNHPGSFRCSVHKDRKQQAPCSHGHSKPVSPPSPVTTCRLGDARRMTSALVRLGGAMDSRTLARRALAPSLQSSHRRRASGFRPRPSRLSAVSFAGRDHQAGDNRQ